ncbi:MAG: DEAD/DEAH box helicase [Nitrososphaerota archaeon]|nr:DEAD/DEAH box helicase [Nitrososphaerota archaeon]
MARRLMLPTSLKPREYQQKIAEAASQANTLVVLPTGLGKTLVALLVARIRLEKFPEGKVVVLAPTKPLVLQHYNSFKEILSLGEKEAALLTGESPPEERSYLWRRSRFVFATPQTVRNDVRHGRVELNDVVLLVFDEAHRSVKDYSYTELAKLYKDTGWTPLILGLTASPGGSRQKINEIVENLFITRVEARSEEDEDVKPYVEQTEFEGRRVSLPQEYGQLLAIVRDVYNEKVRRLTESGFLPKTRLSKKMLLQARATILARLKSGGGNKGYLYGALITQAQAIMVNHALELAETQGVDVLLKYLKRMREKPEQGKSATALLKDPRWLMLEEEAKRVQPVEYPKLTEVRSIVKGQFSSKADSKVIIFTQYRDTIESIVETLAKDGVAAQRFVGQANKADSEGMDQKRQTEVLEKFAEGEFRVLVSSSIGEEGLHVPDVDLVVFYEAVPSEIRAIQRKGRTGRTMRGRVVVLIAEGTVDEAYFYSSLRRERIMKDMVSSPKEEKPARRGPAKPTTLMDFVD